MAKKGVSFDKETVFQYLNLIGLDESEFNGVIKNSNGMKIDYISSLYDIAEANRYLPTSTSKVLGCLYEVLIATLDDEEIYQTKEEKIKAKDDIYYILRNVSSIQVSDNDDSFTIFERTNNLLKDILSGIICCDNIGKLRMLYDNASPKSLLRFSLDEDLTDQEKKLYKLMALSKIDSSHDYNIFNDNYEIDYNRLHALSYMVFNEETNISDNEVNKLEFKRPTYKQLKKLESYK